QRRSSSQGCQPGGEGRLCRPPAQSSGRFGCRSAKVRWKDRMPRGEQSLHDLRYPTSPGWAAWRLPGAFTRWEYIAMVRKLGTGNLKLSFGTTSGLPRLLAWAAVIVIAVVFAITAVA